MYIYANMNILPCFHHILYPNALSLMTLLVYWPKGTRGGGGGSNCHTSRLPHCTRNFHSHERDTAQNESETIQ